MILSGLIVGGSLLAWMGVYDLMATFQVFSNTSQSCINVVIAILLVYTLMKSDIKKTIAIPLILLPILYNFYTPLLPNDQYFSNRTGFSKEYLSAIKTSMDEKDKPLGVYFKHESEYTNYYLKYVRLNVLGAYMEYIKPYFTPLCLSVYDIPKEADERLNALVEKEVETNIFYQYVLDKRKENPATTIATAQLDFIEEYNIQYAVFSEKASIPEGIQALAKEQFIDKNSGEKFIVF